MVDVEQRALRAFEQNALALAAPFVEQRPDRVHVGQHLRRHGGQVRRSSVRGSNSAHAKTAAQRIVVRQQAIDLAVEHLQVGEIHQADGAPADLVFVGRADAAAGGADGALAAMAFSRATSSSLMQRQDQRRVLGDAQIFGRDGDALLFELGDLVEQRVRVEHDAIADDRELARPHHARGQERQFVGGAVDDQRMAGIMAALEADDDVGLLGEPIDDLAFTFVAPLGADHDNICHEEMSPEGPMTKCSDESDIGRSRLFRIMDAAAGSKEKRLLSHLLSSAKSLVSQQIRR